MKAEGFGWLIVAGVLWLLVSANDPEIYAWVGSFVLGIAAVTCSIKAISKFFPEWFDPLASISKKIKRSKRQDS